MAKTIAEVQGFDKARVKEAHRLGGEASKMKDVQYVCIRGPVQEPFASQLQGALLAHFKGGGFHCRPEEDGSYTFWVHPGVAGKFSMWLDGYVAAIEDGAQVYRPQHEEAP